MGSQNWTSIIALITALLAFGGTLYNANKTHSTAVDVADLQSHAQYATLLQSAVPSLASKNPVAASLSIAELFPLANSPPEKRALLAIAVTLHNEQAEALLAALIYDDPVAQQYLQRPEIRKLIVAGADQSTRKAVIAAHSKGTNVKAAIATAEQAPPNNATGVLYQAVTPSSADGWAYYGRFGASSSDPTECVSPNSPMPTAHTVVQFCGSRYLRATKPGQTLGSVRGVIAQGQYACTLEVDPIPLSSKAKAVWLHVQLLSAGSHTAGTQCTRT